MNTAFVLDRKGIPEIKEEEKFDNLYKWYLRKALEGEEFDSIKGRTKRLTYGNFTINCMNQFPLTTLKKIDFEKVHAEFLFDTGFSGNISALGKARKFWAFLADEDGELGATCYNRQWRRWPQYKPGSEVPNETLETEKPTDQFFDIRKRLLNNPLDRCMVAITLNPAAKNTSCPPCHIAMIFSSNGNYLDVTVPSRSQDLVVGFPLDVARYALILHMFAEEADLIPRFIHIPHSNAHIYEINYEAAEKLLERNSLSIPKLKNGRLINYLPNPAINTKVAT